MFGLNLQPQKNRLSERRSISRRSLVKGGGVLAGATALFGGTALAGAAEGATTHLDVACDGRTWTINRGAGADPDAPAMRGDTFLVQGSIYPAGTIEEGLTGPSQEGRIGHWVCRGWFYYDLHEIQNGAAPAYVTTQFYLLDSFDGLISEGAEGGIHTVRAVTGGYGNFRNLTGDVAETAVEQNDTALNMGGGNVVPAPNIRFDFRLA